MFSPRRLLTIMIGFLAMSWAWTWAQGTDVQDPGSRPASKVTVEIDKVGGQKVSGTFTPNTIRIQTNFGSVELETNRVRQLSMVQDDQGKIVASVTMTDKSHIDGILITDVFPVIIENKPEQIKTNEIELIRFLHPKDTSLLAALIGLLTLTIMEIVLGVDNIIFLAIVSAKLPQQQQRKARRIGLFAALSTRLLLLATLSFLLSLTKPIFTLPPMVFLESVEARGISWRDVILLVGGIFLIGKSVFEMHEKLEAAKHESAGSSAKKAAAGFLGVILQIAVIDIIFSLDSVITAVGMVEELWVMITAMLIAVAVMLVASEPIARFVDRRPTVKILALSFLILIGVLLVAEGLGQHIDKGYIYFAMAFAVVIEVINMRLRGSPSPVPGEMPPENLASE